MFDLFDPLILFDKNLRRGIPFVLLTDRSGLFFALRQKQTGSSSTVGIIIDFQLMAIKELIPGGPKEDKKYRSFVSVDKTLLILSGPAGPHELGTFGVWIFELLNMRLKALVCPVN